MLIQKRVVEEPEGRIVFADAGLVIGRNRFTECNHGEKFPCFGKYNFVVCGGGNPLFIPKLAKANITGADEPPVTVVMGMGLGFSFFLFGFRFTATVICSHFCLSTIHHAEIDQLFGMQAGWYQKSHKQQKSCYVCQALIC